MFGSISGNCPHRALGTAGMLKSASSKTKWPAQAYINPSAPTLGPHLPWSQTTTIGDGWATEADKYAGQDRSPRLQRTCNAPGQRGQRNAARGPCPDPRCAWMVGRPAKCSTEAAGSRGPAKCSTETARSPWHRPPPRPPVRCRVLKCGRGRRGGGWATRETSPALV